MSAFDPERTTGGPVCCDAEQGSFFNDVVGYDPPRERSTCSGASSSHCSAARRWRGWNRMQGASLQRMLTICTSVINRCAPILAIIAIILVSAGYLWFAIFWRTSPSLRRRSLDRHGHGIDYSIALVERLFAFFIMFIGFEGVGPRLTPRTWATFPCSFLSALALAHLLLDR